MKPYIVAITGASGAIYGVRLLEVMSELKIPVELVISDTARIVMKEELGDKGDRLIFCLSPFYSIPA